MQRADFYDEIEAIEKHTKNYYGEYISDDSDSDEEKQYNPQNLVKSKVLLNRMAGESKKYKGQLKKLMGKGGGTYQVSLHQSRPRRFSPAPTDKEKVCFYYKAPKVGAKNQIAWHYVVAQPGKIPGGRGKKADKKVDKWLTSKGIQNNLDNIDSHWSELFKLLANDKALQKKLKAENSIQPDVKTLAKIHHEKLGEHVKDDLALLNKAIESGERKLLKEIKTKFMVAQYRGIHYEKKQWNVFSRRKHRDLNEIGQALYSKSVVMSSGIKDFCAFLLALEKDKEKTQALLQKNAERLEKQMLTLRASGPIAYNGSYYLSVLDLLQELYTGDYKEFHALLQGIVDGKNEHIKFLENSAFNKHNPFLSTGDTPQHALKYAYGLKAYGGRDEEEKLKNERLLLKARWRASGKAERPYVGKVYVSLHPVQDHIGYNKPNHIPTLFNAGRIKMGNVIVQEKEASFLGYLPKGKLIAQHKAKYPSFKQKYKKIYEHKYGIDKEFFSDIRKAFLKYGPHTSERKSLETLLGQYLCAYQEVRLVEEARIKAKEQGAVLVYKDSKGQFQLMPSSAIPGARGAQNKVDWELIAQNKKKITELVKKQLEKKQASVAGLGYSFFALPNRLVKNDKKEGEKHKSLFSKK